MAKLDVTRECCEAWRLDNDRLRAENERLQQTAAANAVTYAEIQRLRAQVIPVEDREQALREAASSGAEYERGAGGRSYMREARRLLRLERDGN